VPLALLSACGSVDPPLITVPSNPEHEKLASALTTLVDTLGRSEYAAAAGLICPDAEEGHDEAALRAEFAPHPRPWKQVVTATSFSADSGRANLDLVPQGEPVVKYTFDLKRQADGSWQVCDVSRGSFHVDVD